MAKAHIQFVSKNGALIGSLVEIDTLVVPRAGELLDAYECLNLTKDDFGEFMVLSVVYKVTVDGFVPFITAREWCKGYRHELLQQRGWLMPTDSTSISYDEDDPAR